MGTFSKGGLTFTISGEDPTPSEMGRINARLDMEANGDVTFEREKSFARKASEAVAVAAQKADQGTQGFLVDLAGTVLGAGPEVFGKIARGLGYPEELFPPGQIEWGKRTVRNTTNAGLTMMGANFRVSDAPPQGLGDQIMRFVGQSAGTGPALRVPGMLAKAPNVARTLGAGNKASRALAAEGNAARATAQNLLDVTARRPGREVLSETLGEVGAGVGSMATDNPYISAFLGIGAGSAASVTPDVIKTGAGMPTARVLGSAAKGFVRPGVEDPSVAQRAGGAVSRAYEGSWLQRAPRLWDARSRGQLNRELNENLSEDAAAAVDFAARNGISLMDTGDPELHAILNYVLNDPSFSSQRINGPEVVSTQLDASMKKLRDLLAQEGEAETLQDLFKVRIDADKAELSAAVDSAKNRVLEDLLALRNNPDGTPRAEQTQISTLLVENLNKAYEAAGKQEDALWQQIPENALIDVTPLVNTYLDALRRANPNEKPMVENNGAGGAVERAIEPVLRKVRQQEEARSLYAGGTSQAEIANVLGVSKRQVGRLINEDVKMTVEYGRLRGLNTILNDTAATAASPASPQGQQNLLRRFATQFKKGLDDSFDATVDSGANRALMPEEAVENLRRARAYTAEKKTVFENDPTVRQLINRNSYAEAETEAASGLQKSLAGVREGKMTNAEALVRAARFRSVEESFADRTVDFLKDYLRGDFLRNTVRDEPDMPIDPGASRRWIDANRETLDLFPDVRLEVERANNASQILVGQKRAQKDLDKALSNWEDPQGYGVLTAIVGQPASRIGETVFTRSQSGSTPADRMDQILKTMELAKAGVEVEASLQYSLRQFLAQQAGLISPEDANFAPTENLNPVAVGRALDYVRKPAEGKTNSRREVLAKVFSEDELQAMERSLHELRNLAAFQTKNTDQFVNFLSQDEPSEVVSRALRVGALRGVGSAIGGFGTIQTPGYLADSVKSVSDKVTTGVKRKLLVDMIADPKLMQEALAEGGRDLNSLRSPWAYAADPETRGIWSREANTMLNELRKSVDEGYQLKFPDTRTWRTRPLLRGYLLSESKRLAEKGEDGAPPPEFSEEQLMRMQEIYGPRPGPRTTR